MPCEAAHYSEGHTCLIKGWLLTVGLSKSTLALKGFIASKCAGSPPPVAAAAKQTLIRDAF